MKKLAMIGILSIICTGLKAQAGWETDSTLTPWDVKMDSVFQNVDLNRMHTNMLLNKGFIAQDPLLHNGILSDSTVMDKFKYQSLYYTLFSCQTDTNIFLHYDSVDVCLKRKIHLI